MKIKEQLEALIASQIINTLKSVIDDKLKIANVIVPKNHYDAISILITNNGNIKHRSYDLKDGYQLILFAKDESLFNFMEEVSETPISQKLKNYFTENVLY